MKSKKILTILLSLAIMFTFMPAMAFASEWSGSGASGSWSTTESWASDFASVSITSAGTTKTYSNVTKLWNDGDDGSGETWAILDWTDYTGAPEGVTASEWFYDLNNSEINVTGSWSYANFKAALTADGTALSDGMIKMTKPTSGVKGYGTSLGSARETTTVKSVNFEDNRYSVKVNVSGFDPNSFEKQTVTLTASVAPVSTATGDYGAYLAKKLIGTVPSKTITVDAQEADATKVKFAVDTLSTTTVTGYSPQGATSETSFNGTYDGATHKLVSNEVPGFTVSYELQNPTTKAFEAVSEVAFKDKGTYVVRATITSTAGKKTQKVLTINVGALGNFSFGFDKSVAVNSSTSALATYAQVPEGADPMDYVTAYTTYSVASGVVTATEIKAADKEEALKVFAEKYEVVATPSKANPKVVTWTISAKSDNPTNIDDTLYKTYKTLYDNYGYGTSAHAVGLVNNAKSTTVELVATPSADTKDDDITFSGVTTKSFKAKKKTKKLAKNKTFQIAAVADSGNAITFTATTTNSKIKVSKTGKVTVKKGLKKGTYKVTVKAKTAAGNGYKAAKESKVYTIKIK